MAARSRNRKNLVRLPAGKGGENRTHGSVGEPVESHRLATFGTIRS